MIFLERKQIYIRFWAGLLLSSILAFTASPASAVVGEDWTSQTSGTLSGLADITWNGSQFVAVGDNGVILTSLDAVTWTSQTSGTFSGLVGVTWSGSQLVAVGDFGIILRSIANNSNDVVANLPGTGVTIWKNNNTSCFTRIWRKPLPQPMWMATVKMT
jgi:hypothetical protein